MGQFAFTTHLTVLSILVATLTGCGSITRTERDTYTVTNIDTTVADYVRNPPGVRDNGMVHPSTRVVERSRTTVQYDSVVIREYPDFIRFGLFEGIGLIGSGQGAGSTNTGLFGLFYDVDRLLNERIAEKPSTGGLFTGSIYRFGIGEWRLRVFDDAPGWSWGITGFEAIWADDSATSKLHGIGVLTLNKRWYLRPDIPYLALRASASFAAFPSQYVNLSGSLDVGSIGGLNLRAYAGFAFGSPGFVAAGEFVSAPYIGLGISAIDFLNREEELQREWKYMEHSAWEIGVAEIAFLGADVERSFFAVDEQLQQPSLTGLMIRLAPTTLSLPFIDKRLSLGTSLVSFFAMGAREFAIGVLPIRVSYVAHPIISTLAIEPFLEWMYAPSSMANVGVRAALPIAQQVTLTATLGYVSGNTGSLLGLDVAGARQILGRDPTAFSGVYFGIGAAVFDRLFGEKELRYADR
jgi:hypothetical protein